MIFTYKKLNFEYEVIETFKAGIILQGWELPSIRERDFNLNESYITFNSNERLVIRNSYIHPSKNKLKNDGNLMDKVRRDRELLLTKKELKQIKSLLEAKGLTAVPAKVYYVDGLFKVDVAICRGKKNFDKRQDIKKRDLEREQKRMEN